VRLGSCLRIIEVLRGAMTDEEFRSLWLELGGMDVEERRGLF